MIVGALVMAGAALVSGAAGFGLGVVATPLLLLAGFPLPFVITMNLVMSLATRLGVAYRFRRHVDLRRLAVLVAASLPGLYAGVQILEAVSRSTLKLVAAVVVMAAAAALMVARRPRRPLRAGTVAAGFVGGVLTTTTGLNGVAPGLLLARERERAPSFYGDIAVWAVVSAALGLAVLAAGGNVSGRALFPAFVLWLPGAVAANLAGTALGVRLPHRAFRMVVLAFVFAAGAVTAATAR